MNYEEKMNFISSHSIFVQIIFLLIFAWSLMVAIGQVVYFVEHVIELLKWFFRLMKNLWELLVVGFKELFK